MYPNFMSQVLRFVGTFWLCLGYIFVLPRGDDVEDRGLRSVLNPLAAVGQQIGPKNLSTWQGWPGNQPHRFDYCATDGQ